MDPWEALQRVDGPSPWTPEDYVVDRDLCRKVTAVLGALSERQADVIRRRFGIGVPEQSLRAIGKDLGVGGARIQQIEAVALRRLRHPQYVKRLKAFVDG